MPTFLSIPLLMQPESSRWCGPACAGMVNAYLTGAEVPLADIAKEFSWNTTSTGWQGCSPFDIAAWLASCGVKTEVRLQASKDAYSIVKALSSAYVDVGGTVVSGTLTRPMVMRELSARRPVIASVDVNVLHGNEESSPEPHYVVLVAASHRRVWYLDPAQSEVQVRSWGQFLRASRAVFGMTILFFPT